MREVELKNGEKMEIRPLTRKEIREGKDLGLRYYGSGLNLDNFDDHRDYCLGCVLGEDKLDEIPNFDQNTILSALLKETWGDPGEEKNLSPSGSGPQTEPESATAKPAPAANGKRE